MKIGIDVGGTKIEIVAFNERSEQIYIERTPTSRTYEGVIAGITTLVNNAYASTGERPTNTTIGIGIPGTISPFSKLVKNANSTWLNGKPLDKDLEKALNHPVRIANDANCLAVSEAVDGAGAGKHVVFGIIIGTGCGAGLAIGGEVCSGANAIAGELGHLSLPRQTDAEHALDLPCYCGLSNCIEKWVSGTGFQMDYQRQTGDTEPTKGADIVQKARAGDSIALQAIADYQDRLARTIATVATLLDPDVFVMGGGMSNVDEIYAGLSDKVRPYVFGREFITPIKKSVHGDSSGVRGAAWLWDK